MLCTLSDERSARRYLTLGECSEEGGIRRANGRGGDVGDEDAIHEEWKAHIAPSEAILGVEAAAREYAQAGQRLDKTVAAAKAAGASWADIGRAVGISRQSAHERWADKQYPLRDPFTQETSSLRAVSLP